MTGLCASTTLGLRLRRAWLGSVLLAFISCGRGTAPIARVPQGEKPAGTVAEHAEAAARYRAILGTRRDTTAEHEVARHLQHMGFRFGAVDKYRDIVHAGWRHKHFVKAAVNLVHIADVVRDDFLVPAYLDHAYGGSFVRLRRHDLARVHYHIGKISMRKGKSLDAHDFLGTIRIGHPAHARSRYLLALNKFGVTRTDKFELKYSAARRYLNDAWVSGVADDLVRGLAQLALARITYEQAAPMAEGEARTRILREALRMYTAAKQHRLPPNIDLSLEMAWTHFHLGEQDAVLALTNDSPQGCHAERRYLRALSESSLRRYGKAGLELDILTAGCSQLLTAMMTMGAQDWGPEQWVEWIQKEGPATEVHRSVLTSAHWRRVIANLAQIDAENALLDAHRGRLGTVLSAEVQGALAEIETSFRHVLGKMVKRRLAKMREDLEAHLQQGEWLRAVMVTEPQDHTGPGGEGAAQQASTIKDHVHLRAHYRTELADSLDDF